MIKDFAGVLAIFMSLAIPIVALIAACISYMNKKNRDKEIRQLLIENNVDMERAKLFIEEPEKKKGKYGDLRGGMIMIGMGLGVLADYLIGIDTRNLYFYLILAVGMGVGMLAAFFIEMKLSEKGKNKED